ncbi:hypothetical protein ACFOHT_27165 [Massilia oculi]|jgi:hypothetical protein|uniref:DUF3784 domain-containing protein n=1 Tax=Massilia oculi TaxID=945844 RepID=A0A2S2DPE6_9BURK|nr:hypothetical protein [Massilia oculi]AWL07250.1 hypothetical protein DIR46_24365 [Massilia oculi]
MSHPFLLFATIFLILAIVLYAAPGRRLLNFVHYPAAQHQVARLNRYAALRLMLPALINLGCAWAVVERPSLMVPMIFLTPLSVLGVVVWIAAGARRFGA